MFSRPAFVLVLVSWICAAGAPQLPPKAPVCPAKRADVKVGALCKVTLVPTAHPDPRADAFCSFPGGTWCACEPTRCVTAAGPLANCKPEGHWVCRDDGCPRPHTGACPTEGQRCDYDDGLCASTATCTSKKWSWSQPNCRP